MKTPKAQKSFAYLGIFYRAQWLPTFACSTFLSLIFACGDRSADSNVDFQTGAGPFRGHEDLTRLAVDDTNEILDSDYYPPIKKGTNAALSDNVLVKGNFQSDFPSDKLRNFYNVESSVDWHHADNLQMIHGLRGKVEDKLETTREACLSQRDLIRKVAVKGWLLLNSNAKNEGLYWIGHATHIIQDGFSEAHVLRDASDARTILDSCTYGKKYPGVCYHEVLDSRDRIWKSDFRCQWDPNARGKDCLTPEALEAVQATREFLSLIARESDRNQLDKALDAFFRDASNDGSGFYNCEAINQT